MRRVQAAAAAAAVGGATELSLGLGRAAQMLFKGRKRGVIVILVIEWRGYGCHEARGFEKTESLYDSEMLLPPCMMSSCMR